MTLICNWWWTHSERKRPAVSSTSQVLLPGSFTSQDKEMHQSIILIHTNDFMGSYCTFWYVHLNYFESVYLFFVSLLWLWSMYVQQICGSNYQYVLSSSLQRVWELCFDVCFQQAYYSSFFFIRNWFCEERMCHFILAYIFHLILFNVSYICICVYTCCCCLHCCVGIIITNSRFNSNQPRFKIIYWYIQDVQFKYLIHFL